MDRWILSDLDRTATKITKALQRYRLNEAGHLIYEFFWHQYCDWYLEWVKPRLYDAASPEDRRAAQWVTVTVLEGALRLLHPFMPFITEEIWQQLPREGSSIMTAPWPGDRPRGRDRQAEKIIGHFRDIIVAVRNIRAEMGVPPARRATVLLRVEDEELLRNLEENRSLFDLAKVDQVVMGREVEKTDSCATAVVKDVEVFVPLEGLIDLGAERDRLEKEIARISGLLKSIRSKLDNDQFVSKAPKEVVQRERTREEELGQQLEKLKQNLGMLSG